MKLIALISLIPLLLSAVLADDVNDREKTRLFLETEYQFVAMCKVEKGDGSKKGGSIIKPVEIFQGNVEKIPRWRFLFGPEFFEVYKGHTILYAIKKSDDPAGSGILISPIHKKNDKNKSYFELDGDMIVTIPDLRKFKRERGPAGGP